MSDEMTVIDGKLYEGGGQMLRTALSLSMITKKPFKIINIRKNRKTSGLKPQHYNIIKTLLDISESKCDNNKIGAEELMFIPGKITKHDINIDIKTAGSITLTLQALLPILVFEKKKSVISIKGGTDVKWSPSIDYFDNVILPYYRIFADIRSSIRKRGYYPKGQGEYEIRINPKKNIEKANIRLDRFREPQYIKAIIHASKEYSNNNLCELMEKTLKLFLEQINIPYIISINYSSTASKGAGVTIWCTNTKDDDLKENAPIVFGVDGLLEDKKPQGLLNQVYEKIKHMIDNRIPCDENLCDNLMILLALFDGKIRTSKITDHILSNNYVIEQFLEKKTIDKIEIDGNNENLNA